jgi:virginiamycin B lyase
MMRPRARGPFGGRSQHLSADTHRGAIVVILVALLAAGVTACGSSNPGGSSSSSQHSAVTETAVRGCPARPEIGSTHELTWGSDGNLSITQQTPACVLRITPAGHVTGFAMEAASGPHGIRFDAQGVLWVTLEFKNSIVALDGAGRVQHEYPIPQPGAGPHGLWIDPDGHTVWWTGKAGDVIGRLDPTAARMQVYPLPAHSGHASPIYIAPGPDNDMWFTELDGSRVGRITEDGHIDEFPTPTASSRPIALVSHGGRIWFTEESGHAYADVDAAGNITEHPLPRPDAQPTGIAFDRSGALWIGYSKPDMIARILPSGAAKEFPLLTTDAVIHRVTAGPDGGMWFTELAADKLGRVPTGTGAGS